MRATELRKSYTNLLQQARSGKMRYLQMARLYRERFTALYPEELQNTAMNEYLAYMAVVAERIDKKKLTEAEAEYELARKESELVERVSAMRSQAAAQAAAARAEGDATARKIADEANLRKSNEEAAAMRARQAQLDDAARQESIRQQAAIAAALQAQAEEQRRANATALFLEGVRLLTPPRPTLPTTCRWMGPNWVCM